MNPANQSLKRTYFIGGSPRVGKTTLALQLAKQINGHVASTDAVWNAAKEACDNKDSDLFMDSEREGLAAKEWLRRHIETPNTIVEEMNKASNALWPSLVSFCNSFVEDSAVHIVEGVALIPSLVADMKHQPKHIVYVGNTSQTHAQTMIDYGKSHPEQDWMTAMGYSNEKIKAMANFILEMSHYFKREAQKYGYSYYEISDDNFNGSIDKIIDQVLLS